MIQAELIRNTWGAVNLMGSEFPFHLISGILERPSGYLGQPLRETTSHTRGPRWAGVPRLRNEKVCVPGQLFLAPSWPERHSARMIICAHTHLPWKKDESQFYLDLGMRHGLQVLATFPPPPSLSPSLFLSAEKVQGRDLEAPLPPPWPGALKPA